MAEFQNKDMNRTDAAIKEKNILNKASAGEKTQDFDDGNKVEGPELNRAQNEKYDQAAAAVQAGIAAVVKKYDRDANEDPGKDSRRSVHYT